MLLLLLVVLTLPPAPFVLLPSADDGAAVGGRKVTLRFPSTAVDEEDDDDGPNMSWYDADPDGPSTRKGAFGGGTTAGAMMVFCGGAPFRSQRRRDIV